MFVQFGANGSPVQSGELGAPAGQCRRGGPVPAAAGAEDVRPTKRGAAQTLLEGETLPLSLRVAASVETARNEASEESMVLCVQSSEVCVFLVQTLEGLQGQQSLGGATTDQLL